MKTIDEYTDDLYTQGRDAEAIALVLIRCLDYDPTLILDDAAYRDQVRVILAAMERARDRRMADLLATHTATQATFAVAQAGLDRRMPGGAQ